jgi:hypothetical protein
MNQVRQYTGQAVCQDAGEELSITVGERNRTPIAKVRMIAIRFRKECDGCGEPRSGIVAGQDAIVEAQQRPRKDQELGLIPLVW